MIGVFVWWIHTHKKKPTGVIWLIWAIPVVCHYQAWKSQAKIRLHARKFCDLEGKKIKKYIGQPSQTGRNRPCWRKISLSLLEINICSTIQTKSLIFLTFWVICCDTLWLKWVKWFTCSFLCRKFVSRQSKWNMFSFILSYWQLKNLNCSYVMEHFKIAWKNWQCLINTMDSMRTRPADRFKLHPLKHNTHKITLEGKESTHLNDGIKLVKKNQCNWLFLKITISHN